MKIEYALYISLLSLLGCKYTSPPNTSGSHIAIANKFVDAFYSFNRDSLQAILSGAESSQPNILYYQKWAECGHYQIVDRAHFREGNDSTVIFPVTVRDDLMQALQMDFNVTDTFRILIRNGRIHSIQTSSNDPALYYEAKEWVKQNHPELIEKACEGIWNGGPTPCECIQGMLTGFAAFTKQK